MRLFQLSQELDPLLRLQAALDRAVERPFAWNLGLSGAGAFPSINVFSDAEGYVIRCEVPGVASESLSVQATGNTLTISGKRDTAERASGSFHRRERWSGEFSRALELPRDLDPGKAEASYRKGVLTVRVPRREEAKARQITVQTD